MSSRFRPKASLEMEIIEQSEIDAGPQRPFSDSHMIEMSQLSFRYPGGRAALKDVNLKIEAGEVVGLVGPSGAGKSTLLLHLNGLLPLNLAADADSGVSIGGIPIRKDQLTAIRREVGLLFQDPDDQLFCPIVQDDVAFGPLNLNLPPGEVRQRVTDALAAVDLANYGLRQTAQLSVGERKRVCLAGVLACRPSVLALDEPFSNLDPRARRKLIAILQNFAGTQVIATHDLDLVLELCQRVIVLDDGRVRADGPTRAILSDRELMEQHGLEVPYRRASGRDG